MVSKMRNLKSTTNDHVQTRRDGPSTLSRDEDSLAQTFSDEQIRSMAQTWLEEALEGVSLEGSTTLDDALCSGQLARLYQALDDEVLQEAVREQIRDGWDQRGWLEENGSQRVSTKLRRDVYRF